MSETDPARPGPDPAGDVDRVAETAAAHVAARETYRAARAHVADLESRMGDDDFDPEALPAARSAEQVARARYLAAGRAETDAERQAVQDATRPAEQASEARRRAAREAQAARDAANLAAIADGTAPNEAVNLSRPTNREHP